MFLVEHVWNGMTHLVFTDDEPRGDGFDGTVIEGVSLEYETESPEWRDGEASSEECLGRHPDEPKEYRVFRSNLLCRESGFFPVRGECHTFPAMVGLFANPWRRGAMKNPHQGLGGLMRASIWLPLS